MKSITIMKTIIKSACLGIVSVLLTSCPSAFGYFPNPADRIPNVNVNFTSEITMNPVWFSRTIGSTEGTPITSSGGNLRVQLSVNSELWSVSGTDTAVVFYTLRDANGNSITREENGNTVTIHQNIPVSATSPIRLSDLNSDNVPLNGSIFTAIAIAPQRVPSDFVQLTVEILEEQASAPQASPPEGSYNFPVTVSLQSDSLVPPGSNGAVQISYTLAYSTSIGGDFINVALPNTPNGISLPPIQNGAPVYQYRITASTIVRDGARILATRSPEITFTYTNFGFTPPSSSTGVAFNE